MKTTRPEPGPSSGFGAEMSLSLIANALQHFDTCAAARKFAHRSKEIVPQVPTDIFQVVLDLYDDIPHICRTPRTLVSWTWYPRSRSNLF